MRSDLDSREAFTSEELQAWEAKQEQVVVAQTSQFFHCDRCGEQFSRDEIRRIAGKTEDDIEYVCPGCRQ